MSLLADQIRTYILAHAEKHPADIATRICKHFGVTRMTATRQLQKLIQERILVKSGQTSGTRYYLNAAKNQKISIKIMPSLDEFSVFVKYLDSALKVLAKNQYAIFEYCCTELINNAKDHSFGTRLNIALCWKKNALLIMIQDNGVGIFQKLSSAFHFSDLQEGLLALTKGKITTDKKNHTGEGLFFSSRVVDRFTIEANGIQYIKDNVLDDWFYAESDVKKGTVIQLELAYNATRKMRDVFYRFTDPEEYQFNKTEILVELAKFGNERYISRSQAKRILTELDRFTRIEFDFRGIETVGQGFVDEVFRVFQQQHPKMELRYRNANDAVLFMIKRSLAQQAR